MNTLHAKSPCCQGEVIRFGSRRRQCVICRKTWRIRLKKRGRKPLRVPRTMVVRYFEKSIGTLSRGIRIPGSREAKRIRMQHSLSSYLRYDDADHALPDGPLIAMADAMWYESEGIECAVYFILLRPINASYAWILPPVIVPGRESARGWHIAFEEIPSPLTDRICALVCDGKRALRMIAQEHHWALQLCHFHLLGKLKHYASGHPGTRWEERGKFILSAVRGLLNTQDETVLARCRNDLLFILDTLSHRFLKAKLREFRRNLPFYRTYLSYPHLHLPTTTNSAEALIRMVRELLGRARGFRTVASLERWLRAFCRYRKTIACRGKSTTELLC